MLHRKCTGLLLCAVTGLVAATMSLPPAAGDPSRGRTKAAVRKSVEPGQIDLERSRVYIYVDKTGLGHEHAIEGKIKSGEIQFGAKANAGLIEFDMTSFVADSERSRKFVGLKGSTSASTQQQVNTNMLGADVLNTRRYPTATFTIASAVLKKTTSGAASCELKGDFALRGKARSLTLNAQLLPSSGSRHLRGEFTILQTEYGITPYSTALGAIGVADRLKIWGDIWIAGEDTVQ